MNIPYLRPSGEAKFTDREVTRASHLLVPWQGAPIHGLGLVGVPLGKTSISHSGAALTPGVVRSLFASYTTYAIEEDMDVADFPIADCGDVAMHVTDLTECHRREEEALYEWLHSQPQMMPIIVGGDHSITAPSIRAFIRARGDVGIIQFDAHHDLRNLEDGGPSNGTPFRQLIESEKIKGEQLIQIGIRNFSNSQPYSKYAAKTGVTVYPMGDVEWRGIIPLLQSSLEKLRRKVKQIYVSVDMDVLDQTFAPGCPAIGPGGMDSRTLLAGIRHLAAQPDVVALDIVEIDPTLDVRDMTSRLAVHIILSFLLEKRKLEKFQNQK